MLIKGRRQNLIPAQVTGIRLQIPTFVAVTQCYGLWWQDRWKSLRDLRPNV
jgi:hypothetical protein